MNAGTAPGLAENQSAAVRRMPERAPALRAGLGQTVAELVGSGDSGGLRPRQPGSAVYPVGEGGTFETRTFRGEAGTLAYKLYIPSRRSDERLPLVVMLHGCRQSPDDFAAGTRMNLLAEEQGLILAYPAQSAAASARRCWNWFRAGHQERDRGEPAVIAGIVREILRDHPADPDRVYVAGLSAGGAAAAVLAEVYPDIFAAVGVHSGLATGAASGVLTAMAAMWQAPARHGRGAASLPTIVFHGDQDRTVHVSNGKDVVAQVTAGAGALSHTEQQSSTAAGQAWTRAIYADAAGRSVCESWTLHEAGHAWAGGDPSGSYTDPDGPDASREMLRFFLQHTKSAPVRAAVEAELD